jgi:hypothetical protein
MSLLMPHLAASLSSFSSQDSFFSSSLHHHHKLVSKPNVLCKTGCCRWWLKSLFGQSFSEWPQLKLKLNWFYEGCRTTVAAYWVKTSFLVGEEIHNAYLAH